MTTSIECFLTVAASRSLARVKVLFASIRRTHPAAQLFLAIADDDGTLDLRAGGLEDVAFINCRLALGNERYRRLAYTSDESEFCSVLIPHALHAVFDGGAEQCHYFDPGALVMQPLDALFALQSVCNVTLVPYQMSATLDTAQTHEMTYLQQGAFDPRYLGLSGRPETMRMLDWWSERLERPHVAARGDLRYLGARWLDLVPGLFDGVSILRDHRFHAGPDIMGPATWPDTAFAQLGEVDPEAPNFGVGAIMPDIARLYANELVANGQAEYSRLGYGHDHDQFGFRLDRYARVAVRREPLLISGDVPLETALDETIQAPSTGQFRYTHYIRALYEARADLRMTFPDALGADAPNFAGWLSQQSTSEASQRLVASSLSEPPDRPLARDHTIQIVSEAGSRNRAGSMSRSVFTAIRALKRPVSVLDAFPVKPSWQTAHVWRDDLPTAIAIVCGSACDIPAIEPFGVAQIVVAAWDYDGPHCPQSAAWTAGFDEIWVASAFMVDAVSRHAPVPVVRVPPVISVADAPSRSLRSDIFSFLVMFDYLDGFARKNPAGAIAAFRLAFRNESATVRLTIATRNAGFDPDAASSLIELAADDPRISVRDGSIDAVQRHNMLVSCGALLSLHRLEEFAPEAAEAMGLGKPVIATAWSGNSEYMSSLNSWPIPYRLVPFAGRYGVCVWADPDIEAAADSMRAVYNGDGIALIGRQAQETIRERYSALAVAARVADRLQALAGHTDNRRGRTPRS